MKREPDSSQLCLLTGQDVTGKIGTHEISSEHKKKKKKPKLFF